VYPVITDPFVFAGGSQDTVADAFAAVATTLSGTEGAAFTATDAEAVDATDVPATLVAVTWKV
jgi:hypothetical protein